MFYNLGMDELPLFPLNVVLFPGLPLQLNIFEDRYKQLLNDCIQAEKPFGVVLIKRGEETHGPLADPHPVGCTAQLVQIEPTPGDRFHVTSVGLQRFRILALDRVSEPYLTAQVEFLEFEPEAQTSLLRTSHVLRPLIKRYLTLIAEISHAELDFRHLPDDPVSLAFFGTYLLQMPAQEKQAVLEMNKASEMIAHVVHTYRREMAFLRVMVEQESGNKNFWLN